MDNDTSSIFIARHHAKRNTIMANLSVRPSHSGIVSKRMHISIKLFPQSGRDMRLVFKCYRRYKIPRVTSQELNTQVEKVCNFLPKSPFISETI